MLFGLRGSASTGLFLTFAAPGAGRLLDRRRAWLERLLVALAATALAACATLEPPRVDASASFSAHGRVSVHYRPLDGGKEDTLFGRFEWIEHGQSVDLTLLDPLGQGIATIHAEPGHARLKLANGQEFFGPSADDLTQQALGYLLPVQGLRSWLMGRPSDPSTAVREHPDGGLVFDESGWTVRYPAGITPPNRIELSYPGPGVALDLRLAVEDRDGG